MLASDLQKARRRAWWWLLVSGAIGMFTGARWPIPLAAWVGPVFGLRFVELQRGWTGFVAAVTVSAAVFAVSNRGAIPVPVEQYAVMAVTVGLLGYLINRIHCWAIARWPSGLGTLVFPSLVVALEYLSSFAMFGSWTSTAVLQAPLLSLAQLASVTGIWGIAFLVLWTTALAHWCWSIGLSPPHARKWLVGWAGVMTVVFGFGQWRLMHYANLATPLTVAAIAPPENAFMDVGLRETISRLGVDATADRPTPELVAQRTERLLGWSRQAAQAGARWVCWSEAAQVADAASIGEFDRACSMFARESGVHLAATVGLIENRSGDRPQIRNLVRVWGPDGGQLLEQQKRHVVPGEPSIEGDGVIRAIETPDGRIASVVCFDTDFPAYLQQLGRQRVGLLLAPSNDWRAAARMHLAVASYRAIENGCSMLRPTSQGISVGLDPTGRARGELDAFATPATMLLVQLPSDSIPTVYSQWGDWFAWAAIFTTAAFLVTALSHWLARRGHAGPA